LTSLVARMNLDLFAQPLLQAIGFAGILSADGAAGILRARYVTRSELTHSGGRVLQGGIVTAWMDSAMAMVVYAHDASCLVSSLELKVSFLEPVGNGAFEVEARILRQGRNIAFLEADVWSDERKLHARASSTGKLIRRHEAGGAASRP